MGGNAGAEVERMDTDAEVISMSLLEVESEGPGAISESSWWASSTEGSVTESACKGVRTHSDSELGAWLRVHAYS